MAAMEKNIDRECVNGPKRACSGGQLGLPSVPPLAQVTLSPFDCSKADATTKAAALPFSWFELFPLECGATLPAVRHIRG